MASASEITAMRRALALASRGLGRTSPNPVVGAVVLAADGTTAGEGFHERAGAPHAEVVALAAAGERARGGTVVATLEPCSHRGRTGPCTRALLDAGVARVVIAVLDPSPRAGGGAQALTAAGLDVETGVLVAEASRGNEAWLHAVRTGRPFVTWKYAASLDGRVAAADGTSRWITSEQARRDVHRLRSTVDAVVIGTGTALADDPHLTARDRQGGLEAHQPVRVVVGGRELPTTARVLDDAAPTITLDRPPAEVLSTLHERGVRHALLEGGPTLAGSFWRAGLVDRVVGYVAPVVLGAGAPTLAAAGVPTLEQAPRLDLTDVERIGPDLRVVAYPRSEA